MSASDATYALCKAKLLHDFGFFVRYFFKSQYSRRFILQAYHALIFEALERVSSGQTKRLIINIPPRYAKTEIAIKMFIAWALANSPTAKFIHLSYSDDLALDNSSAIRDLVKSEEFQRFFPMPLRTDSDSKKKWFNTSGGGVYATSSGGAITGFGAGAMGRIPTGTGSPADGFGGCILIDDPNKPDDAFSDTLRERINRRFNNTIASRTNAPDTPIVVIMQRLHENDMTGYLLGGGSGEEWEHLCLPAINEAGEPLWKEKHSIETLRAMEAADPYTFAGQYMQRPSPLAGGIMKPDSIPIIEAIPKEERIEWVRGWDLAASVQKGDWTAGALLGKLTDGRVIIADMVRVRAAPDERDAAILNAARRDGDTVKTSIPQDPGQSGKSQVQYLVRQLAGYNVKTSPDTGSKSIRAMPFAAQVNVGNVLMLKAEWNAALISEMRMFPNGTHDDQVDACTRAFNHLLGKEPSRIYLDEASQTNSLLQQAMPSAMYSPNAGNTCGQCAAFDSASSRCTARGFGVGAGDAGCDFFEL